MHMNSIHPSLLFFEKGLPEHRINKVIQTLQGGFSDKEVEGQHKHQLAFREVNELLGGGDPHIGLMFTTKAKYSHTRVPGYISVPCAGFNAQALKEYVEENVHECRLKAKDYC